MIKRFLLYSLVILVIAFSVTKVYTAYQPKAAVIVDNTSINYVFPNKYTITEFENYVKTTTDPMNVIFYSENDVNSQYFFNVTIPAILTTTGATSLNNVIYVNTENVDTKSVITGSKYGYNYIPALANIQYTNGKIVVLSILEEDGHVVFDNDSILDWLKTNKIIVIAETEK